MNIYARYFDRDVLVFSFEELMNFLLSIPEIPINQRLIDDVKAYVESDLPYPKRYKIRPRVYFILIKTNATSMEEFKSNRKHEETTNHSVDGKNQQELPYEYSTFRADYPTNKKEIKASLLSEIHEGWYFCTINFKRVIQIATTSKFRYTDTEFQVYVRASSGAECYDRIMDHLKNRPEIDSRSQFPSARGTNFNFEYIGTEIPA